MPRAQPSTRIEQSPDSRRPYGKGKIAQRAQDARDRLAARAAEVARRDQQGQHDA